MIERHRTETIVRERYAASAKSPETELCCPVNYESEYLKVIPSEVIERDYGCGDPSRYLREGETVLDLGSGTGKICFIAAQIVGPKGKVIGIDMTDEMLEVARRNAPIVANRTGYANVEFRKGRIQDLALDLERLDQELERSPITNATSFLAADELAQELRVKYPLVASDSIDVVVSNCVLNLVEPKSKRQLFEEIFRVLRKGGRAVICDIVSDEPVPDELQDDLELWSGCISGALRRTVQGIEFRSVTIEAFKGKQGECFERNQAVIYRGPFKEVLDDDNHRMERGKRYAVCDKTYNLYKKAPYSKFFEFVEPIVDVPPAEAKPFDCSRTSLRHPKATKGQDYDVTTKANNTCCDGGNCC
ncbi:MAG: methyltransferase domain-containing protein [Verrucomicrobia bacterium]|nr:MAG: methyltransferase domain-containing protein [Verrucomicrobiota bacterium]